MNIQTVYQETIKFACAKHLSKNQTVPGTNLPYIVHVCNVAMEILVAAPFLENFDLNLAVQVALLHDTIEDTDTTFIEIENIYGNEVAQGVLALSKNEKLPKDEQMFDSLKRIKSLKPEIRAVKLADRITNLQAPPSYWDNAKKIKYQAEANTILNELRGGNEYLEKRLEILINDYSKYILS